MVHAAANTNVDGCELEPDNAYRVNALGSRNVAVAAAKIGAKLVYISTDYVFDGAARRPYTEFDAANPISDDDGLLSRFGQASMSKAYPGVIKAFHYHEHQDDLWFFPVGNAQVVLYDLREDSPTRGETNVFYMGEDNPVLLVIPKMVAHGYRVLGSEPAVIIYFTTMSYHREKPDEKRIAWDDPTIDFDWMTKNR